MLKDNRSLVGMGLVLAALGLACKTPQKQEAKEEQSAPAGSSATGAAEGEAAKPKPVAADPEQLISDYKANEVRADAKYKDRRIVSIGVVDDIKKDAFGSIYIILVQPECFGRERFANMAKCGIERVQAYFEDSETAAASALDKGTVAAFDCTVSGLVMMNVILRKCSLAKIPGNPGQSATVSAPKPPGKPPPSKHR